MNTNQNRSRPGPSARLDPYVITELANTQPDPDPQSESLAVSLVESAALGPVEGCDPLSAPVVAALEATWTAIRRRHPDLPAVVVVLASGSVGAPRGMLKLGHFAAMRWDHAGTALPEVFIGGEGLARGPRDVLGTLLHEAVHALADVRGIRDTSRQGRYHNRRFADLAASIGLQVTEAPLIGWSTTHLPETTAADYATELEVLRVALTIHRRSESDPYTTGAGDDPDQDGTRAGGDTVRGPRPTGGGRPSSNNGHAARCGCGRRIRVSPATHAQGGILCALCRTPFTTEPTTEPTTASPAQSPAEPTAGRGSGDDTQP